MHRQTKAIAKTEGNLALDSESLLHTPSRKFKARTLRLVQSIRGDDDLSEEAFFRLKQLLLAIGLSIALCFLWFLVVYILYTLARSTVAGL